MRAPPAALAQGPQRRAGVREGEGAGPAGEGVRPHARRQLRRRGGAAGAVVSGGRGQTASVQTQNIWGLAGGGAILKLQEKNGRANKLHVRELAVVAKTMQKRFGSLGQNGRGESRRNSKRLTRWKFRKQN